VAYVSPTSIDNPTTGGTILTAWGDGVNAATDYLATNKPHCRVYNSAAFTHNSTGNSLAITFNSERVDVGGCHSTVSNTSRLTVPAGEGGWYAFGGGVTIAANATGVRILWVRLNGTTSLVKHNQDGLGGNEVNLAVSSRYQLAAADYIELMVYQNSGGNLNVNATGNESPEFWMEWVAT